MEQIKEQIKNKNSTKRLEQIKKIIKTEKKNWIDLNGSKME